MVMNNLPNLHKPHNRFSPHKPYSPHNSDNPHNPYSLHSPHNHASINSHSKKLPSQERRSSRSVMNQVLSVVAVDSTLTDGL